MSILDEVGILAAELVMRVERLLGAPLHLQASVIAAVRMRAAELEDPATAPDAALALMGALYPDIDPPREFWATQTGQAVAQAIGYHRATCPFPAAAAILNVTRQRIYQLCDDPEGGLVRSTNGEGVIPASLRDYLWLTGRRAPHARKPLQIVGGRLVG